MAYTILLIGVILVSIGWIAYGVGWYRERRREEESRVIRDVDARFWIVEEILVCRARLERSKLQYFVANPVDPHWGCVVRSVRIHCGENRLADSPYLEAHFLEEPPELRSRQWSSINPDTGIILIMFQKNVSLSTKGIM